MQYFRPDSPTLELEVDDAGIAPPEEGPSPSGRKLTEAQEHYSKHHAEWLAAPLKADVTVSPASPVAVSSATGSAASARMSRFGLRVSSSPAFVAGGSLHSTSTQNKAVLLPPTLSSSSPSSVSHNAASPSSSSGAAASSPSIAAARGGMPGPPSSGAADAATSTGSPSSSAAPATASPAAAAGGKQAASTPVSASPRPPLNIDSRAVLSAAAAAVKTRALNVGGGLPGTGAVKTLENSATSSAAGALVAAAFGRGAAVTGSTPQSAKFAAAAAAAEAAARAAAAGRTDRGLPPDALVDGLPVQSFSHLRVMKEGTCVEVFCLPLLFQKAGCSGRLILGRAEAADIPTEHPSCSRLHCELRRQPVSSTPSSSSDNGGGGSGDATSPNSSSSSTRFTYTLKDLGSGHGTLINGGRVAAGKDTTLEDEDEIQLGFSQRLYLFFTGKDTFGPDSPPPPSKETPPGEKPLLRKQSHSQQQGPRSRLSPGISCVGEPSRSPTLPPGPVPPSTPPPPAPPPQPGLPGGDEAAGLLQQQRQGADVGVAGGSPRIPPDRERSNSVEDRWLSHQQHMERLHNKRIAALGGSALPHMTTAGADTEQVMMQQQQQQAMMMLQQPQQHEGFADVLDSEACSSGLNAAAAAGGGGGGGAMGWGWDAAQQQQQLLYWQQQQQQQGMSPASGWEAGSQGQVWGAAAGVQEHAMQLYMADQYAPEYQCWDAAAAAAAVQQQQQPQQQQHCSGWSPPPQHPPVEEVYSPQHQPRRSGWSSMPSQSWTEGEQQEGVQECDGLQQQQQQRTSQQADSSPLEGRDDFRGTGVQGGRGVVVGTGRGGFKRNTSSVAARKLLWKNAGKKQQEDETSAAAAGAATGGDAAAAGACKRLRLDGAKAALRGRSFDGLGGEAMRPGDQTGAAAAGIGGGEKEEAAGAAATVSSSNSSGGQLSGSIMRRPSSSSPIAVGNQSSGNSSSNSKDQVGSSSNMEEKKPQHVFCAHILLSFVRRVDTEPWEGSKSSNSGVPLLGRGGRVVTRSRVDALSSLRSVKDITSADQTQFGEFAVELSDCPSSKKRGVLGWVHAGLPGGRPASLQQQQQQQQQTLNSSSSNSGKARLHQRRTATEVAAQPAVDTTVETDSTSSSSSKATNDEKQEDWWLPQEVVDAALQLQIGELSDVVESEHGAHLLLRLK